MKKILLTLSMFVAALTINAQAIDNSYSFTDENGNVLPDGATVYPILEVDKDFAAELEVEVYAHSDLGGKELKIKNNLSETGKAMKLIVEVTKIDEGFELSYCFPTNCYIAKETGTYQTDIESNFGAGAIKAAGVHIGTSNYGECIATIKVDILDSNGEHVAYGPSATMHFYLPSPTSIDGITTTKATEVARYSADGKLLSKPVKGLNIIKMSDGTTVKKLEK